MFLYLKKIHDYLSFCLTFEKILHLKKHIFYYGIKKR